MKKKVLYGVTLALLGGASMVSLQSCKDDLSDLEQRVDIEGRENFKSLKELWDYCRDGANSLDKRIQTLEEFMKRLNDLDTDGDGDPDFVDAFTDLRNQVNDLVAQVNALPLDELDNRVTELYSQVDNLVDRLTYMITGLITQRAFGPAFGDFSLPVGVQSNLLFNWYGEKVSQLDQFPSQDGDDVAAGIDFLNNAPGAIALDGSEYDDLVLGDIYLTVNPVGHNFDGTKLTLENSKGEKLGKDNPYVLEVAAESDYLLKFGTRAADGNGFYKAHLQIKKDQIADGDIDASLDYEALKSAAKEAAKNPSIKTAANLVKAVYDQITTKEVPAYALRYDWTAPTGEDASVDADVKWTYDPNTKTYVRDDSGNTEATATTKDYAVLGNYDIAVVTAKPLSFNSLKGLSSSKQLPTGHLANFLEKLKNKALEKFEINTSVTIDGNEIAIASINFGNKVDGNGVDNLVAEITGMTLNGSPVNTGRRYINPFTLMASPGNYEVWCGTDVDGAIEMVNTSIVDILVAATENDSDAFRAQAQLKLDAVLVSMNEQINKIVDEVKGTVENGFNSIQNSNYFELANRAFNLYNRFANKVNHFLADPNAALQVAALYDTKDDLGFLSQNVDDPTPFVGEGNSIKIYLTTYTGEVLAPAFKKYFACIDDSSVNTGDLATVLDGNTQYVVIENLPKGKHEFVYQALDYAGYTSTKKFYIEVK